MSEATVHVVPPSGAGLTDRMLEAFTRLWAFAILLHIVLAEHHRIGTPSSLLVAALACAVLVAPRSAPLFTALLVAQLVDMLVEMPTSPDHWMLDGFVGLAILGTMAVRREASIESLRRAVPGVRIVLLIAYSAAALSKYNTSFLDPVTSCANALASRASFGATADLPLTSVFPWLTLVVESSVPVLLLIPATRRWGVRLGMVFHCLLTLSPQMAVQDFSATLFALFFLFLSPVDGERMLDRLGQVAGRSSVVRDLRRHPRVAAAAALVIFGMGGYLSEPAASAATNVVSKIILVALVIAAVWSATTRAPAQRLAGVRWVHVPVLALTLFWAANPYLGLRTTGVFSMFSSLRTEGDVGNHLFLPSVHLTSWQDDLVQLRSSNNPGIDRAARSDLAIPLFELRAAAMADPGLTVSGVLDGRTVEFGPSDGQRHFEPVPWWERKYAHFRVIPVGSKPFCSNS